MTHELTTTSVPGPTTSLISIWCFTTLETFEHIGHLQSILLNTCSTCADGAEADNSLAKKIVAPER